MSDCALTILYFCSLLLGTLSTRPPTLSPSKQATTTKSTLRATHSNTYYLQSQYIIRTFTNAAPNLTINGLPVDDPQPFLSTSGALSAPGPEEQHEPFDGRKRTRVEALAREEEDLLREIAALKRRVPAATAAAAAEQFRAGIAADEEALERARDGAQALSKGGEGSAGAGARGGTLVLGPLERQDGVEAGFAGAVAALGKLKREMPATVAKMERARVAGEYVVTER